MFKHLAPAVLAAILLAGCAPSLGPGEPSTTPTTVAPTASAIPTESTAPPADAAGM